jgi:hypothetical protein
MILGELWCESVDVMGQSVAQGRPNAHKTLLVGWQYRLGNGSIPQLVDCITLLQTEYTYILCESINALNQEFN